MGLEPILAAHTMMKVAVFSSRVDSSKASEFSGSPCGMLGLTSSMDLVVGDGSPCKQVGLSHFKVGLVQHKQTDELVKACLTSLSI